MEMKDIYDRPTMIMPGHNTIKTLEVRKNYILKKLQSNLIGNNGDGINRYYFLIKEIRALEKTINFVKWLINNSEDDNIKNIVEKYRKENGLTENEQTEIKGLNKLVLNKKDTIK